MTPVFAAASNNTSVDSTGTVHLSDNSGIGGASLFGGGVNAVSSTGVVDTSPSVALAPGSTGGPVTNDTSAPVSNAPSAGTQTADNTGAASGATSGNGANGNGVNGGKSESDIDNNQVNTNTVWNNTNVTVDDVNGDVNVGAAATANAFEAVTMNNTVVNNNQTATGAAVGSDLNTMATNINGSVNLSNTVACNTADVSTDPAYTVVNSKQTCAVSDPSQATNVFVAQVQNDVNVSGSVAANAYTEDTNAKYNYVNTNQINSSAVNSTTNVQAYNVGGTVNVSSSAVGNTAQVVHY
jgi:hypothetical protein